MRLFLSMLLLATVLISCNNSIPLDADCRLGFSSCPTSPIGSIPEASETHTFSYNQDYELVSPIQSIGVSNDTSALSLQQIWARAIECTRIIANAHNSKTIAGEIVVKGSLECSGNTPDSISATATISLFRGANQSGSFFLVSERTVTRTLNTPSRVKIPNNVLVAATPCIPGWYYGNVKVAYYAPSGRLIAFTASDRRSPSVVYLKC